MNPVLPVATLLILPFRTGNSLIMLSTPDKAVRHDSTSRDLTESLKEMPYLDDK